MILSLISLVVAIVLARALITAVEITTLPLQHQVAYILILIFLSATITVSFFDITTALIDRFLREGDS